MIWEGMRPSRLGIQEAAPARTRREDSSVSPTRWAMCRAASPEPLRRSRAWPRAKRSSTAFVRELRTAQWRAEFPRASLTCKGWPAARRHARASQRPCRAARWRGVVPSLGSAAKGSLTPTRSRSSAPTSGLPLAASWMACWRTVRCFLPSDGAVFRINIKERNGKRKRKRKKWKKEKGKRKREGNAMGKGRGVRKREGERREETKINFADFFSDEREKRGGSC